MGLTQADVHHGKMINQGKQLMQKKTFLVIIINLVTVKNQTISIK
jgi:hypothetical protein